MRTVDISLKKSLQSAHDYKDFIAVLQFKDQILDKWRKQTGIGDSDFETIRLTMEREYKIKGLEEFFDTLYRMAYDGDAGIQ